MARGKWRPEGLPVAEVWKPDVCEEFGCDARHPSFSRDGMKGPWRCREHDAVAVKRTDADAVHEREAVERPGLLL